LRPGDILWPKKGRVAEISNLMLHFIAKTLRFPSLTLSQAGQMRPSVVGKCERIRQHVCINFL